MQNTPVKFQQAYFALRFVTVQIKSGDRNVKKYRKKEKYSYLFAGGSIYTDTGGADRVWLHNLY